MAKHTKGPLARSKHGTPDYAPQFGIYAEEGDGRDIAIVRGENAQADSLLFAAAPDLLEALQGMLATWYPTSSEDYRRLEAARNAIQKATQE